MTREEKLDRLDGVFAWDMGCHSSGIKDDDFKASLRDDADGKTDELLTAYARQLLNGKDYSLEDLKELIDWAERELEWCW